MFFIIGLKSVIIGNIFTFHSYEEGEYFESLGGVSKNQYYFISLFWIPIIPVYCSENLRDINGQYYIRKIPRRGMVLNNLMGIIGIFILLVIITLLSEAGLRIR